MKRRILPLAVLASAAAYSQVGVGTTTPNKNAQLEVKADNKGVLIPRVGLKALNDRSPIQGEATMPESLLVYNTVTSNGTTADTKFTPGFYYWYENRWMRVVNQADVQSNVTNFLQKDGDNNTALHFEINNGTGDNAGKKVLILADKGGNKIEVNISELVKQEETVTKLAYDKAKGELTYTSEKEEGNATINLSAQNLKYDAPEDKVENGKTIPSVTKGADNVADAIKKIDSAVNNVLGDGGKIDPSKINSSNISGSTEISVTGGDNAVLKEVTLGINNNSIGLDKLAPISPENGGAAAGADGKNGKDGQVLTVGADGKLAPAKLDPTKAFDESQKGNIATKDGLTAYVGNAKATEEQLKDRLLGGTDITIGIENGSIDATKLKPVEGGNKGDVLTIVEKVEGGTTTKVVEYKPLTDAIPAELKGDVKVKDGITLNGKTDVVADRLLGAEDLTIGIADNSITLDKLAAVAINGKDGATGTDGKDGETTVKPGQVLTVGEDGKLKPASIDPTKAFTPEQKGDITVSEGLSITGATDRLLGGEAAAITLNPAVKDAEGKTGALGGVKAEKDSAINIDEKGNLSVDNAKIVAQIKDTIVKGDAGKDGSNGAAAGQNGKDSESTLAANGKDGKKGTDGGDGINVGDNGELSVIGENGITSTDRGVRLGGTLNRETEIVTSKENSLVIKGLQQPAADDTFKVVVSNDKNEKLEKVGADQLVKNITKDLVGVPSATGDAGATGTQGEAGKDGINVDPTTGKISVIGKNGITSIEEGVKLGGDLIEPTKIKTDATNTLAIEGLQNPTDTNYEFVVADKTSGVLKQANTDTFVKNITNNLVGAPVDGADGTGTAGNKGEDGINVDPKTGKLSVIGENGITSTDKGVKLGGALTEATEITTSKENTLKVSGLQNPENKSYDLVVAGKDGEADVLRKVSADKFAEDLRNDITSKLLKGDDGKDGATGTAGKDGSNPDTPTQDGGDGIKKNDDGTVEVVFENGLTRTKDGGRLGGELNRKTTITTTAENTLAVAGLQDDKSADYKFVVSSTANDTNGVLKTLTPSDFTKTITNNLVGVPGENGAGAAGENGTTGEAGKKGEDGINVDPTTGKISVIGENGITSTDKGVKLGGALTETTKITTAEGKTLAIEGLKDATKDTYNFVVSGKDNSVLQKLSPEEFVKQIADNLVGKDGEKGQDGVAGKDANDGINVNDKGQLSVEGINGITSTDKGVKLGGALTEKTEITTSTDNTLAIKGLENVKDNEKNAAKVLVQNADGVVRTTSFDAQGIPYTSTPVNPNNTDVKNPSVTKDSKTIDEAIKALDNEIQRVREVKGNLTGEGIVVENGDGALLQDAKISIADGAITTDKLAVPANAQEGAVPTIVEKIVRVPGDATATGAETQTVKVIEYKKIDPSKAFDDSQKGDIEAGTGIEEIKDGANRLLGGEKLTISAKKAVKATESENSVLGVVTAKADSAINIDAEGNLSVDNAKIVEQIKETLVKGDKGEAGKEGADGISVNDKGQLSVVGSNGITSTKDGVKLGGDLTEATKIKTDATNTLTIEGLQAENSDKFDFVVSSNEANKAGELKKLSADEFVKNVTKNLVGKDGENGKDGVNGINISDDGKLSVIGENGITTTKGGVKLGGALTEATTLTTDKDKTLTIAGLQEPTDATTAKVVVSENGVLRETNFNAEKIPYTAPAVPTAPANGQNDGTGVVEKPNENAVTKDAKNIADAIQTLDKEIQKINQTKGDIIGAGGISVSNGEKAALQDVTIEITAGAITGDKIAANTITNNNIADNTISLDKLEKPTGADSNGQVPTVEVKDGKTTIVYKKPELDASNFDESKKASIKAGTGIQQNGTGDDKSIIGNKVLLGTTDVTINVDFQDVAKGLVQEEPKDAITSVPNGQTPDAKNDGIQSENGKLKVVGRNGVESYENGVQLGGALTHATEITTSATNTLAVKGLQAPAQGKEYQFVVSENEGEKLQKVDASTFVKNITNNLVGVAGANGADGTTGTEGAGTTGTNGKDGINVDATTGKISVVGENGITSTDKGVKLGGELSEKTTLKASETNTLAVEGLQATGQTSDRFIVQGTDNVLKTVTINAGNLSYANPTTTPAEGSSENPEDATAITNNANNIQSAIEKLDSKLREVNKGVNDAKHPLKTDGIIVIGEKDSSTKEQANTLLAEATLSIKDASITLDKLAPISATNGGNGTAGQDGQDGAAGKDGQVLTVGADGKLTPTKLDPTKAFDENQKGNIATKDGLTAYVNGAEATEDQLKDRLLGGTDVTIGIKDGSIDATKLKPVDGGNKGDVLTIVEKTTEGGTTKVVEYKPLTDAIPAELKGDIKVANGITLNGKQEGVADRLLGKEDLTIGIDQTALAKDLVQEEPTGDQTPKANGTDADPKKDGIQSENGKLKVVGRNGIESYENGVQLGGALTHATEITADTDKTLAIKGLQNPSNANYEFVVADKTSGVLKQANIDTFVKNITTNLVGAAGTNGADGASATGANGKDGINVDPTTGKISVVGSNGITSTENGVELGGNITKETTLAVGNGGSIKVTGLENNGTATDKFIVQNTDGTLKTIEVKASDLTWNGDKKTEPAGTEEKQTLGDKIKQIEDNISTVAGTKAALNTDGVIKVGTATNPKDKKLENVVLSETHLSVDRGALIDLINTPGTGDDKKLDTKGISTGELTASTGIKVAAASAENAKTALLKNVTIELDPTTIEANTIPVETLKGTTADAGKVPVVGENGTVTYQTLGTDNITTGTISGSGAAVSTQGTGKAVGGDITITVATANGTTEGTVKQKADKPSVTITTGELDVNVTNLIEQINAEITKEGSTVTKIDEKAINGGTLTTTGPVKVTPKDGQAGTTLANAVLKDLTLSVDNANGTTAGIVKQAEGDKPAVTINQGVVDVNVKNLVEKVNEHYKTNTDSKIDPSAIDSKTIKTDGIIKIQEGEQGALADVLAGTVLKDLKLSINRDKLIEMINTSASVTSDNVSHTGKTNGVTAGQTTVKGALDALDDKLSNLFGGQDAAKLDPSKINSGNLTSAEITVGSGTNAVLHDVTLTVNKINADKISYEAAQKDEANPLKDVTNVKDALNKLAESAKATDATKGALTTDGIIIVDGADEKSKADAVRVATKLSIKQNSITANELGTDSVTSDEIAADAVDTAEIKNNAVTTDKIADANVTEGKLANNAVTTNKIADANVTEGKLANSAVTTNKIADANVTEGKLANNAVTTNKIADGAVTEDKLAGDIPANKITGANLTGNTEIVVKDGTGAVLKATSLEIGKIAPEKISYEPVTPTATEGQTAPVNPLAGKTTVKDAIDTLAEKVGGVLGTDGKVDPTKIASANITGDTEISVTGGENAVLKEVRLAITEVASNKVKYSPEKVTPAQGGDAAVDAKNPLKDATSVEGALNTLAKELQNLNTAQSTTKGALSTDGVIKIGTNQAGATNTSLADVLRSEAYIKVDRGALIDLINTPETGDDKKLDTKGISTGALTASTGIKVAAASAENAKTALLKNVTIELDPTTIEDNTIPVDKLKGKAADKGKVPVVGENGTVTYQKLDANNIGTTNAITGTGAVSVSGTGKVIGEAVSISVATAVKGAADAQKLGVVTADANSDINITDGKLSVDVKQLITNINNQTGADAGLVDATKVKFDNTAAKDGSVLKTAGDAAKNVDGALKALDTKLSDLASGTNGQIPASKVESTATVTGTGITVGGEGATGGVLKNVTLTLDKATDSKLGGVIVGDNISVDNATGKISVKTAKQGTAGNLGLVTAQENSTVAIDGNGNLSVNVANLVTELNKGNNTISADKVSYAPAAGDDNPLKDKTDVKGALDTLAEKVKTLDAGGATAKGDLTTDGIIVVGNNNETTSSDAVRIATKLSIKDASITNDKLAGNISADKLAGNIPADKLAGNIPADKLAGNIPANKIIGKDLTLSGGLSFPDSKDGNGAVLKATEITIKDGALDLSKLKVADNATAGQVPTVQDKVGGGKEIVYKTPVINANNISGDQKSDLVAGTGIEAIADGTDVILGTKNVTINAKKASGTDFGVVKVGTNIDVADGTISVATATKDKLGLVKPGTDISITTDGTISVDRSVLTSGIVKGDTNTEGDGIKVDAGKLSVVGKNGITSTVDGVKLGGTLTEATTLTTDATKTLSIAGLQNDATADNLVVAGANGKLGTIAKATFATKEALDATNQNVTNLTSQLTNKKVTLDTARLTVDNKLQLKTSDDTAVKEVNLSRFLDNTDNQTITKAELDGTNLKLQISGGDTEKTVDLSTFATDAELAAVTTKVTTLENQDYGISIAGRTITLEGGKIKANKATVTIPTESQTATASLNNQTLSVSVTGQQTPATVDLGTFATDTEVDTKLSAKTYGIKLNGRTVTLTGTGAKVQNEVSFELPADANTDQQQLTVTGVPNATNVKNGGKIAFNLDRDTATGENNDFIDFKNGLTVTSNKEVKLGGALSEATTIESSTSNTLAITGLQKATTETNEGSKAQTVNDSGYSRLVVQDSTGKLKYIDRPLEQFYAPPIVLPVDATTATTFNNKFGNAGSNVVSVRDNTFTVNLHQYYIKTFGTPKVSSAGANTKLKVFNANELDYHVTAYDESVYENVAITAQGVLTYTVKANAEVTEHSYMIVVFKENGND